jgi:aryl-alcohol dehydrogenase-like predicted oxidoreductase
MPSLGASERLSARVGDEQLRAPATSRAILDTFVAGGGNFIDTADTYSYWVAGNSGGEAEAILGDWLAARGKRPDVVVATKVSGLPAYAGLRAANIAAAVEQSLRMTPARPTAICFSISAASAASIGANS